jgi:hypothetical protein
MQFISNKEVCFKHLFISYFDFIFKDDKQDEEKLIKEAVSTLRKVQCRLCKGEHWTTKCPYKDNLQSFMDQSNDKPSTGFFFFSFIINEFLAENVATSTNKTTSQGQNPGNAAPGETSTGKWVSVRVRNGTGTGTAYPGERGSTRGGSYAGRPSDRKQGLFDFVDLIFNSFELIQMKQQFE